MLRAGPATFRGSGADSRSTGQPFLAGRGSNQPCARRRRPGSPRRSPWHAP